MAQRQNGKTIAALDEKLAAYQELKRKFTKLRDQLGRAEKERGSVDDKIYEKVTSDYNRELDAVRSQLAPLKAELDEVRSEFERERDEALAGLQLLEDLIAEAAFRHRVGEFTEERYEELVAGHRDEVEQIRGRTNDLEALLRAFDTAERSGGEELPAPESTNEDTASSDVSPNTPPPAPSPEKKPADNLQGFVNPNDWFHESRLTGTESAGTGGPQRPDVKAASDGAGPKDDAGQFPNLVALSGPHRGKIIPLLPMTMSVGREHDNNIELKDPEVARYHARIRYDSGAFVLEDLDSSTGTYVNGARASECRLKEGDVLRIGGTELAVEYSRQPTS